MNAQEYKDAINVIVKRNNLDRSGGWHSVPVEDLKERNRILTERIKSVVGSSNLKLTGLNYMGRLFTFVDVVPTSSYWTLRVRDIKTNEVINVHHENALYKSVKRNHWVRITESIILEDL